MPQQQQHLKYTHVWKIRCVFAAERHTHTRKWEKNELCEGVRERESERCMHTQRTSGYWWVASLVLVNRFLLSCIELHTSLTLRVICLFRDFFYVHSVTNTCEWKKICVIKVRIRHWAIKRRLFFFLYQVDIFTSLSERLLKNEVCVFLHNNFRVGI